MSATRRSIRGMIREELDARDGRSQR
jgi:hypothetical protein